jgi:hypothetical protein
MLIPSDVMITMPNSSLDLYNFDNNAKYTNVTYKLYEGGNAEVQSVKELILWNLCKDSCAVGSYFSFMIDWIRNPIAQINVKDLIVFNVRTKEGFLVERGITQSVVKLFSELVPARIQNLQIRSLNPVPNAVSDLEIIFSADAEFKQDDYLQITLPSELNFILSSKTSRQLGSVD